ncbi:hypothetical protein PRZ48_014385 [Zasmidium cellare]|uniref:Protein kinase domain-containing protein n=1 Tax=Zasmidium cellare TaxID=395010 RepID=A0ABR0DY53_ZASCE|nr:hypothetical protein PRZ48_014385 [Zasmidium cellare]
MAAPGFGFSVGDFIAAIELIGKAAKALKETSGATRRYRQAALELEGLASVLRQVQALRPTNRTDETIRKIHLCAHVCYLPLQSFLSVVQKLEASLGTSTQTHWPQKLKSGVKKIQWAILLEKELAKLKASIGPSLTSIDLLLQLESIERGKETQQLNQKNFAAAQDVLLQVDALKSTLLQQVDRLATRDQVTMLTQLVQTLSQQNMSAVSPLLSASHQAILRIEGRLDGIDQYMQQDLSNKMNSSIGMFLSTSQDHITSNMYRRFDDMESLIRHSKIRDQHGVSHSWRNSGTSGRPFVFHQTPNTISSCNATAGYYAPHSDPDTSIIARATQAVLDAIHQRLNELLGLFVPFLGLQKFFRTAWTLLRGPSLLLDSNIELEDALGRTMSLPFYHFHIWSHVQAKLELDFEGFPGELWIKQRIFQFDILNQSGRRLLTWEEWDAGIKPGSKVLMAMRLDMTTEASQKCPNCSTANGFVEGRSDIYCTKCDLTYTPFDAQPGEYQGRSSVAGGSIDSTATSDGEKTDDEMSHSEWGYPSSDIDHGEIDEAESSGDEAHESDLVDTVSQVPTTDHTSNHSTRGKDHDMLEDIAFFKRVHVLAPAFRHAGTLLNTLLDSRLQVSLREEHPYSSLEQRKHWTLQIIEAVAERHRRGQVHPALTLETVYIDDEGAARLTGTETTDTVSPLWLPPEIARYQGGAQSHGMLMSRKGNVYQLGMMMFALAELDPSPDPGTLHHLRADSRLPLHYRTAVVDCLEPVPNQRPSAAELLKRFTTNSEQEKENKSRVTESDRPTEKGDLRAVNHGNTTEDRVRDTADAFKRFANDEKIRMRQAAEAKRANQRPKHQVSLNDLKKFAANFKLKTPRPDDL